MKANKDTARAARLQAGNVIDILAGDDPEKHELATKLVRDILAFLCAAEFALPDTRRRIDAGHDGPRAA